MATAQTLVSPTLADNTWYSSCGTGSYLAGLNTAMIDYVDTTYTSITGYNQLVVSAYYGNNTAGGIEFMDLASGNMASIPYCGTARYIHGTPDIIVGNDATNPISDYRVAVVYRSEIDFYLVHYTGAMPGALTASYITSVALPATSTPYMTHIDVIADYSNTGPTGLPFCDDFVVTWDEVVSGSYVVDAAVGNLNSTSLGAQMSTTLGTLTGYQPDVAATQRLACYTCTPTDEVAMIAYTDNTLGQIYYAEWDITTGTLSTPIHPWPSFSPLQTINQPRIDADNDPSTNYPSSSFSYYKIAALAVDNTTGLGTSYTFDNILALTSSDWQNSQYCPSGINDGPPSIAFGVTGGTYYQVAHYNDDGTTTNLYMEPIKYNNPTLLGGGDLYQVNYSAIGFINGNNLTSISSPCNNKDVDWTTFTAWSYGLGSSTVYYKATQNIWAYRHSQPQHTVHEVTPTENWQAYPNPANMELTVNNPGGSYEVTDMLGRKVLNGALIVGAQKIDISSLVAGTYIFTGSKDGKRDYNCVIVKE